MQIPLFVHGGTPVTGRDFAHALSSLGIRAGSTLFVHSGLQAFGKLPAGMTREPLCLTLIDVLLRAVGKNGTVVMPTFNYAFCRGVPFNVQKTPSEVGTLSEFFRGERHVVRSKHPIFSVAAYGKRARDLTAVNMDSFGPGTFFANFLEAGGTFIFMGGATFCNSCTFIHQIERTPFPTGSQNASKAHLSTAANEKSSRRRILYGRLEVPGISITPVWKSDSSEKRCSRQKKSAPHVSVPFPPKICSAKVCRSLIRIYIRLR